MCLIAVAQERFWGRQMIVGGGLVKTFTSMLFRTMVGDD